MSYYEDNRPGPKSPIDQLDSETLVDMAAAAVQVLSHSDLEQCPDAAPRRTGWLISTILETVSWRSTREFYEQQDKLKAKRAEVVAA